MIKTFILHGQESAGTREREVKPETVDRSFRGNERYKKRKYFH